MKNKEIEELKRELKEQQDEIEKLKKKAKRQKWWNVFLVWSK